MSECAPSACASLCLCVCVCVCVRATGHYLTTGSLLPVLLMMPQLKRAALQMDTRCERLREREGGGVLSGWSACPPCNNTLPLGSYFFFQEKFSRIAF